MSVTRERRWGTGLVATLTLVSVGLLYASATLLTAAVIPMAYVLYGTLSGVPAEARLRASRQFVADDPSPGEAVTVELTVTNDAEDVLADVRIVDGVPEALSVVEGSPRACVALAPGRSTTVSYDVVAKRGEFAFDDPVVRVRSLAATERVTAEVETAGERSLSAATAVREPPLQDATLPRAGTLPTDTGGSGLEFYATRQYRPSDPMNRVDWRHYAKTGEFVTVQYREEQAIRTVVVVDARASARVTPAPGYPTGAELCAYAGQRLYEALSDAGLVTSVTAVGLDRGAVEGLVGPDGLPWVDGEDTGRGARAEAVFRSVQQAADSGAGEVGTQPPDAVAGDGGNAPDRLTRRLLARLPPNAQVVVCTPLVDNWSVTLARSLAVRNYPLVVLSPDVTGADDVGQRTVAVQRALRLRTLERTGANTVGWDLERPIDHTLRRSLPHLL